MLYYVVIDSTPFPQLLDPTAKSPRTLSSAHNVPLCKTSEHFECAETTKNPWQEFGWLQMKWIGITHIYIYIPCKVARHAMPQQSSTHRKRGACSNAWTPQAAVWRRLQVELAQIVTRWECTVRYVIQERIRHIEQAPEIDQARPKQKIMKMA